MSDLPAEPPPHSAPQLAEGEFPPQDHWDGVWDRSALRRLLGLAGPEAAAEILHHLRADLHSACDGLGDALSLRDGAGLHRAAHVLIALCGTVGATALCTLAERLHQMVEGITTAPDEALTQARALISGVSLLCAALLDETGPT